MNPFGHHQQVEEEMGEFSGEIEGKEVNLAHANSE
jgi:hypothetical protein